jgi:N-acetylglucosaminyldiphosphoundecaprenol N-acetyl-beta-D-mannosaminyltransferase
MKSIFRVVLSLFILIFITLPLGLLFYILSLFRKKDIFSKRSYYIKGIKKELYSFNRQNYFISILPLFFYSLKGDIDIVGISFQKRDKKEFRDSKSGIFNLVQVYKNSKITFNSVDDIDREYINQNSFKKDLSIILKSFFTSIFYHHSESGYSEKVKLFDIEFFNISMREAIEYINSAVSLKTQKVIFFMNPDCFNQTFKNPQYINDLKKADYIFPDGSGVNLACKILNQPLKENINGTDMFPFILEESLKKSYNIFFLGAKDEVVRELKEKMQKRYPALNIVGIHSGYFSKEQNESIIEQINSSKANILFVAFGVPIQERWIIENRSKLNINVILGVGGLFDFYSDKTPRAPKYLREIGLEWTYRLKQEPKRMWKRYILGNPLFLYRVYYYKIKRRFNGFN